MMETEKTRPRSCFWNKSSVWAFGRGCGDCESEMWWLDSSNLLVYFNSAHVVFFRRLLELLVAQRWGAFSNGKISSPGQLRTQHSYTVRVGVVSHAVHSYTILLVLVLHVVRSPSQPDEGTGQSLTLQ